MFFKTCLNFLSLSLPLRSFKIPVRGYTPRRACLYVPACDLTKIEKSFGLNVDCIILDCESGVACSKKHQARSNIKETLDIGKPQKKRKYDLAVRVNSLTSGIIKEDLNAVLTGKNLPDTIFIPNIEKPDELIVLSDNLNEFIKGDKKISLIVMVESATSLINLVDICKKAVEMSTQKHKFVPKGLVFGSDDFCASIGARRSDYSSELIYARQKIVAVAKAFNLQAIDMSQIQYKDLAGLEKQSKEAAGMGFTGKQVIDPGQVEVVQNAFMPSQEQIKWASDIIAAYHKHQKEGKGAFVYNETMIDMPTMKQAQNIVDLVNSIMMQE